MTRFLKIAFTMLVALPSIAPAITYEGKEGPGFGKHIVLISGDEEYRSEESLPMLGKILSQRHGFKCTVLFAINKKTGEIDPNTLDNIPGLEALESADLMLVDLRFRNLPDAQMKYIHDYLQTGKPVIGIRPSVVAFKHDTPGSYDQYSCSASLKGGFGKNILGADWTAHHGSHGGESTRGIINEKAKGNPILQGVNTIWGSTDVYAIPTPIPGMETLLVQGQVLTGMKPDSAVSSKSIMPLAWTRHFGTPKGPARAFMTTIGDARDFLDENLRRLMVNACYWAVGLEDKIPAKSNVDFVDPYLPTPFGFNGFVKGRLPAEHALGKVACTAGCCTAPLATRLIDEPIFKKSDHVCLIGNTLADRMQHFGWTETYIQSRYPDFNLTIRDLGFAADELDIRPRSENFGSPDEHLTHSGADVVLAFFGYNESFDDAAGLPAFKKKLVTFIDHTLAQKYNGKSAPRLVLFSPIAHENLHDPNLPDGKENNRRLALYSAAMAQVAKEKNVSFVDLFTPTAQLYASHKEPLTINGIHLNDIGQQLLGALIDKELAAGAVHPAPALPLEQIRQAVLDKNLRWFNRYRATDGYSTYGTRAYLKFIDGQTNKDVLQRELQIIDVMTANRDQRIWSLLQGKDIPVKDDNLPKELEVKTNLRNVDQDHPVKYLSGEEAIGKMKIAKGMEIKLFASEKEFPNLINPVQMSFDTDGRMWVASWHTYPHWDPMKKLDDKILIFPDENGDGKADKCIVFADNLHNPTGFEFWNGGIIVACQPEILFLKDTNGDNKADVRINLLSGIDSADTHCGANSFVYGPDGYMYFSEGIFHFTNIETPWGKPLRTEGPMLYRFNPRTCKIENHFVISPNPHGIVFDDWGRLFATDATTGRGYYVGYPNAGVPHELYKKRVRPVAGLGRITGSRFLPENRGNLLICNTIGFLGILQHKFSIDGADITSNEIEPIVVSTDGNFRPVDVEIGGDGALYFLDWQNAIIGHMQHNLRDPSRDHTHGRIYRVTAKDRPLLPVVKMSKMSVPELVQLLASPEYSVRYRARIELSGKDTSEVLSAANKWVATLKNDTADAKSLTEALWLHQQHNRINRELLLKVLASPVPEVRAAATRALGQWGEEIEGAVKILQKLAADPSPLVRAEAIVAAASFTGIDAAEVMFVASQFPLDPQISYDITQTRRKLDTYWRSALRDGATLSSAGQKFVAHLGDGAGTSLAGLLQDSANNFLQLHRESSTLMKDGEFTGITYATLAKADAPFQLYQLRPLGQGKYQVVNASSFKADGKPGDKTIKLDPPWKGKKGDLLAHSGSGGPGYWMETENNTDEIYYPVDTMPAAGQAVDLTHHAVLPHNRRYALNLLIPTVQEKKADVVISTVPEQMRYNLKEFTVKAGKKFTLRFENPDNMPHNIVFAQIGAKEEVGHLADKLAADPEAAKRDYVPDSPKVIFHAPIVDDHSQITVEFTAPEKPGDYPYMCTFPGHWTIMNGTMKVVE